GRAWGVCGADSLAYSRTTGRAAHAGTGAVMNGGSTDRTHGPAVPDPGGDHAGVPAARPGPRNLPRWLLWAGGAMALAICLAILLMWGILGPAYIFDLIAAYCA